MAHSAEVRKKWNRLPDQSSAPATKVESGHDENISEAAAPRVVGADLLAQLKRLTLALYAHGMAHAEIKGHHPRRYQIRVWPHRRRRAAADERDDDADSSRYWPKDTYR